MKIWWHAYFPLLWGNLCFTSVQFGRSVVSDSVTPWIAACQAYLFITISQISLIRTSTESMMPSSHLILCRPLLYLLSWVNKNSPHPLELRIWTSDSNSYHSYPGISLCSPPSCNSRASRVIHSSNKYLLCVMDIFYQIAKFLKRT